MTEIRNTQIQIQIEISGSLKITYTHSKKTLRSVNNNQKYAHSETKWRTRSNNFMFLNLTWQRLMLIKIIEKHFTIVSRDLNLRIDDIGVGRHWP